MRNVFLYMTMTFDGFVAGPNNELDWMSPLDDREMVDDVVAILGSADTGIMGYPTAPGMVAYWSAVASNPHAPEFERRIAQAIMPLHTVVVSNREETLGWEDSELLLVRNDDDLVAGVAKLKAQPGRDIGIPGGVRTGQNFARLGLVDEYMLMIHPIAIGAGRPLFTNRVELELTGVKVYRTGVMQVRYRPRGAAD